jgi:hypothetical protein
MADMQPDSSEPTAVDDVRRVREKLAREHGGDLHKHLEETHRIAANIRARLKVKVVPAPAPAARRRGG